MFSRFRKKPENENLAGGNPNALIELRRLVKKFRNAAGEVTVLKGIDAAFQAGEFASIVGRSGSGKSTLLNMITGIDHPSSGYVRVGDAVLHTMDEGQLSVWRGKNMGIVFQFFQLLPMLTLLENVMLPMDFCNTYPPAKRESRAKDLLTMVGLAGLEHKYPAAVSGGQQQSAAVARALANAPPILVADEPTGNLDSRTAERVLEIFEEQAAKGKTIFMVTHDSSLAQRAKRVLVISDGELIPEGISRAFPALTHDLMLQITHMAQVRHFDPGEVVMRGEDRLALLLVTGGAMTAIVSGQMGTHVAADVLRAGSLFSRVDQQSFKRILVGLRAESEAEALVWETLPESTDLADTLNMLAQKRAAAYLEASNHHGEVSLLNGC
ncbi:MAG: ATP-binding cassette domain-containing protein [Anaerolineaceae bacterium]|nr:ATP-binding cassette domain-containing protein [Anaerolineaceae bacterium]